MHSDSEKLETIVSWGCYNTVIDPMGELFKKIRMCRTPGPNHYCRYNGEAGCLTCSERIGNNHTNY